jgi:tRNA modification GTPase
MSLEDTIAALSTPVGESGIGIVRMSGRRSFSIAKKIFRSPRGRKIDWTSSFRTHYGWIVDSETGKFVDEVLLTLMRAPKTYTREDIVEINCHGGSIPLRKTLELTLKSGARLAEPGEFTKRAFLKGRIDLSQAESVLEIVQAKTEKDLELAVHQLKGDLSRKINGIKKELVDLLSYLEAEIDFGYEDIAPLSKKEKENQLKRILMMIDSLLEAGKASRIYRQGLKAVIIGKPNVGKSSLLNTLLQNERAIVSYTPGTTRDTIEEMILIKGFPLWIIDTAGLREVESQVEKEAVRRTRSKIEEANIMLLMVDGSCPLGQEDESIFKRIEKKKTLVVINKIDLPQKVDKERIRYFFPGARMVEISATQEINLAQLKEEIANFALKEATLPTSNPLIINLRQQYALELTSQNVNRALGGLREEFSEELIAFEVKEGISRLGEITGEVVADEILDQIFSHFCIGK